MSLGLGLDSDTWTDSPTLPSLNQGRVHMEGAVAADGYFYVIGGRDGLRGLAENALQGSRGVVDGRDAQLE